MEVEQQEQCASESVPLLGDAVSLGSGGGTNHNHDNEENDHVAPTIAAAVLAEENSLGSTQQRLTQDDHRRHVRKHHRTRTMEKVVEGMRVVADNVRDSVFVVKEAVADVAHDVKEAVVEELHQVADPEQEPFLEMTLSRTLSILPDDMVKASHALQEEEEDLRRSTPPHHHQRHHTSACVVFPDSVVSPRASLWRQPSAIMVLSPRRAFSARRVFGEVPVTPTLVHDDNGEDGDDDDEEEESILEELPPDENLQDEDEDSVPHPPPPPPPATPPLSAYLLLLSSAISLSSNGPLMELQHDVHSILKVTWRSSGTAVLLFPLAVQAFWYTDRKDDPLPRGWTWWQWMRVPMTAFMYTIFVTFFSLALSYTAVGNAVIMGNSQSLLLLLGKFLVGHHVTKLEAMGALVAFGGALFCSKDSSESAPSAQQDSGSSNGMTTPSYYLTYMGDGFALLSAIGGAAYIVFAKTVRSHLNLYVFMFLNMFQTAVFSILFAYIGGVHITFDRHVRHGAFGWVHHDWDRLPLEIIIVLICNVLGAMGYVCAMQYFDSLVISVAALMEPVMAELIAFGLGVGFLPGWKGWLGNILVTVGTLAVVYKPHSTKNTIDKKKQEEEEESDLHD